MARWVNSVIRGKLKESTLCASEEESIRVLGAALQLHRDKGERVENAWGEHGAYWEVFEPREGALIGRYWLSDENEGATG